MRVFARIAFAVTSVVLLGSCATTPQHTGTGNNPVRLQSLSGTSWLLVATEGLEPAPVSDDGYSLAFAEDGGLSGRAACNRIVGAYTESVGAYTESAGAYTESAGRVSFTMLASTKMFCLDAPFSDAFVAALDDAISYAIDGDRLSITLANGGVLRFEREQ